MGGSLSIIVVGQRNLPFISREQATVVLKTTINHLECKNPVSFGMHFCLIAILFLKRLLLLARDLGLGFFWFEFFV